MRTPSSTIFPTVQLGPSLFDMGKEVLMRKMRLHTAVSVYFRSPPSAVKGKTGNLEIVRNN